jgi:hypothetical protein
MAQYNALFSPSGPRGRRFKSSHSDHGVRSKKIGTGKPAIFAGFLHFSAFFSVFQKSKKP